MNRYKYPEIPHLTQETKIDFEVVITEKLDGELAVIYSDGYYHTHSLKPKNHPSRAAIRSIAYGLSVLLPRGWRLCGENLFARRSIYYKNLPSYFFVFDVVNDLNEYLPWDQMVSFCQDIGVHVVPVIYRGTYSFDVIQVENAYMEQAHHRAYRTFSSFDSNSLMPCLPEGYVIRKEDCVIRKRGWEIPDTNLKRFKYIRSDFVKKSGHSNLRNHAIGSFEVES
jgi:hypothetical protein